MLAFFIFVQAKYAACVAFISVICDHTIGKTVYMIKITLLIYCKTFSEAYIFSCCLLFG